MTLLLCGRILGGVTGIEFRFVPSQFPCVEGATIAFPNNDRVGAIEGDLTTADPGRLDCLARAVFEALVERLIEAATARVEEAGDKPLKPQGSDNDSFRQCGSVHPALTLQPTSVPPYSCSPPGNGHNIRLDSVQTTAAQLVEALPRPLAQILPAEQTHQGVGRHGGPYCRLQGVSAAARDLPQRLARR